MISDISLGTWLTISFPLFMYTAIVTVSFLDRYTKYLSLAAWYRRWCWSLCWKQRQERDGGQRNCTRVLLACSCLKITCQTCVLTAATIWGWHLFHSEHPNYYSRVASIQKNVIHPEFDEVTWLPGWNKFQGLHVDWQDILKHHKTLWNTMRH